MDRGVWWATVHGVAKPVSLTGSINCALQPRLTPTASPHTCAAPAEPARPPRGPAPNAPDSRPQGQRRAAGGPSVLHSQRRWFCLPQRTALCLSLQPPSPPAPPGAAPLPEQRGPGPRPPPPARCGSPARCRTRTSAPACSGESPPGL